MKIIAVIPVRLNSKRFPRKALFNLGGMPMIERVYRAVSTFQEFADVVVATDSTEIYECVKGFEGKVFMTSSDHRSGTERMSELLDHFPDYDVFVNIQGDNPFLSRAIILALLHPYLNNQLLDMTTVACPLRGDKELKNPNTVKVLINRKGYAIYFTRSDVPYKRREIENVPVYQHLGLYAFSASFLRKYAELEPTPLDISESLEQLRVLEHGYQIKVNTVENYVPEINTLEDIEIAKNMNLL